MNTAAHSSTGFCPAFLNFGRELRLPLSFCRDTLEEEGPNEKNTPQGRSEHFKVIQEMVRQNLHRAFKKQAYYYNLRRRHPMMQIGQQVLYRRHDLSDSSKAFAAKPAPRIVGPYTVIGKEGENIFQLKSDSGRHVRAHVKDLKPYLS
ncbi:uncharacterized protein LOC124356511 [Homalodisca vitripennis]|uniref:uncharacterized protein LOC124356511 n=1 Tax=Homalodisca vitripennis TaxID=197043 RepID=UPI001EEBB1C6|nr:uncharacterized protein LOC124356511 [Homalodisca vitripennis]